MIAARVVAGGAPWFVVVVLGSMLVGCGGGGPVDGDGSLGGGAEAAAGRSEAEPGQGEDVLEVAGQSPPVRPVVEIPEAWDSEIEEVYGRYWLYWEAFAAAHGLPNADPSYEPLRALSTDDNWASLTEQLRGFADDGVVLVLPENSMTEHLIRIPNAAVLSKNEGAEVVLQDCWIDDFVQQTVDGQIVAEAREAKLMNVVMKVVDGEWRVDGVTRATADSDGFEQCATLVTPS